MRDSSLSRDISLSPTKGKGPLEETLKSDYYFVPRLPITSSFSVETSRMRGAESNLPIFVCRD
jgi:hypothetical protein